MSDLPTFCLEESAPFTHIGMDCFGPFVTVDERKEKKRYGVVFTCLASRAVHIEVIDDMSTDTFINSLRCFVAIRGPVRSIVCDRGSNFVGASNELKRAAKEINYDLVKNTLSYENCDFFFNVPQSSHMGGVWERQIRTIRNILNAIMKQHSKRLNLASLRTFMYETMAIVNSRPIAVSTLGDSTQEPLTPNHLLTMKSKIAQPLPGRFDADDIYSRKRWRIVQQLCNEFWDRWRKEYLCNIQTRQKWNKERPPIKTGDIVVIKDTDVFRGQWSLGRVVKVMRSADGLVRKTQIQIGDPDLADNGKRTRRLQLLERPVHKLVVVLRQDVS